MSYVPDKGDVIWIDFSPQKGHEQKGRRPAVVLSSKEYNKKTGLALFCPITSKSKGYLFEVMLTGRTIKGVILSDQIRNLDWQFRKAKFIEKADKNIVLQCIAKIIILISDEPLNFFTK